MLRILRKNGVRRGKGKIWMFCFVFLALVCSLLSKTRFSCASYISRNMFRQSPTSCFYSCLCSRHLCTHSFSTRFSSAESLSDLYPAQVSQNGWRVWFPASWVLSVGGLWRLVASQLNGSIWGL